MKRNLFVEIYVELGDLDIVLQTESEKLLRGRKTIQTWIECEKYAHLHRSVVPFARA